MVDAEAIARPFVMAVFDFTVVVDDSPQNMFLKRIRGCRSLIC